MSTTGAVPGARTAVRQTGWITAAAVTAYIAIRSLPVDSGALHYDDFRAGQVGPLEFCEPGSPQFAPVDRVRSPVSLDIRTDHGAALRQGEEARLVVRLTAASGKPVTADDLLVIHTQKLHLLVIDPSLDDYQHLHPVVGTAPGEFVVPFTPRGSGDYRVFADFMPRATGRSLYAGAHLEVTSRGVASDKAAATPDTRRAVVDDLHFELTLSREPARASETTELQLTVRAADGSPAALEEIMGAHAHVVAFDAARSGFAHLHPLSGTSLTDPADAPLRFQLNLTEPGTYRLWAQVKVRGRERFAPFVLTIRP